MAEGHEGVHGLPRLRDGDDEGVGTNDRIAVAELARELDLDRDAGPVLDRVLRDHACVRRSAAGDDDNLVHRAQVGI